MQILRVSCFLDIQVKAEEKITYRQIYILYWRLKKLLKGVGESAGGGGERIGLEPLSHLPMERRNGHPRGIL